ncbi:hypothetical protein ACFE04_001232 [Oxalis oulophora]
MAVTSLYDSDNEFELDIHNDSQLHTLEGRNSSEPLIEKHISVDPKSLEESSSFVGEVSFNLMLPPIITPKNNDKPVPQPSLPVKFKFLSNSVPSSAASSPRLSSFKKKLQNENPASPPRPDVVTLLQESFLSRSKSCGDGRSFAPSDKLDVLVRKKCAMETESKLNGNFANLVVPNKDSRKESDSTDHQYEHRFKCLALCLFIPAFVKGKPVKPRKPEKNESTVKVMISRTVSLEKFECGSWASSVIVTDQDDELLSQRYFDLPLELMRSNTIDPHHPVNSAFVFDKDQKSGLKNVTTRTINAGRKSHESGRQVRFSVSSSPLSSHPESPCITPRLMKAREEFNAFLEAQTA